jgi:hypothetical protein
VSAHNFLHQKDNFRMYYFNLSFMSFRCVVWGNGTSVCRWLFSSCKYQLYLYWNAQNSN